MLDLDQARQVIHDIDREMAQLFEKRMDTVGQIAAHKIQNDLPVEDLSREQELLQNNLSYIKNEQYRSYYARFLNSVMTQSKHLQHSLRSRLLVDSANGGYDVIVKSGGLHQVGELFSLNRKVLVVTDSGVPEEYGMTVASQCAEAVLFIFEHGEASKNMDTYSGVLQALSDNGFTRTDCIVAVGGGVVSDVAGFAAATYMRGIDYYSVPTTVLSQADASIGGKTAINFSGYKNTVGAFCTPKAVLVDVDTLQTLPQRHIANGMAEIIKMALTHDKALFTELEANPSITEEILIRALHIKKQVVEQDERESNLRKVLNFGHTLGHAIECVDRGYLHGECVAIGMLAMCAPAVRERLLPLLQRLGLPTSYRGNVEAVIDACRHDKKMTQHAISVVCVPYIGSYEIKSISFDELATMIREVLK